MRRALFIFSLAMSVLMLLVSVYLALKVHERNAYCELFVDMAIGDDRNQPTEEIVMRLSDSIFKRTHRMMKKEELDWFSRFVSLSFFNVGTATALRYGGFGIIDHSTAGPCGTMTRVLLNALWKLDIPARKLQLLDNEDGKGGGHTMIEFLSKGRWLVISPADSSFTWRRPDGAIATAEEIRGDPAIFSQIYARFPSYPYLFDRYSNIRWEKVPPRVRSLIRLVLGKERYEKATTPRLYDQPRSFLLILSLVGLAFFAAMALATKRKRARLPMAARP